jgi:hypothetical protein
MAVSIFEKYRSIEQAQHEIGPDLYRIPGVTGSAVGHKTINGVDTKEPALIIFVRELANASTADFTSLVERLKSGGTDVDIVQSENITTRIAPVALQGESRVGASRTDKIDPMVGGISCGPDVNIIWAGYSGTLGLVVKRQTGDLGVLSNNHVLFYDTKTKTVCQPARVDSLKNHRCGHDLFSLDGNWMLDGKATYVDAAVATVDADRTASRKTLFGVTAQITGIKTRASVAIGDAVTKSGLTTGLTTGTVKYLSIEGPDGREPNQFGVVSPPNTPFAKEGDSGSVVLIGTEVMGLLWGLNEDAAGKVAVVTPIEAVFAALNIEL